MTQENKANVQGDQKSFQQGNNPENVGGTKPYRSSDPQKISEPDALKREQGQQDKQDVVKNENSPWVNTHPAEQGNQRK